MKSLFSMVAALAILVLYVSYADARGCRGGGHGHRHGGGCGAGQMQQAFYAPQMQYAQYQYAQPQYQYVQPQYQYVQPQPFFYGHAGGGCAGGRCHR